MHWVGVLNICLAKKRAGYTHRNLIFHRLENSEYLLYKGTKVAEDMIQGLRYGAASYRGLEQMVGRTAWKAVSII